MVSLPEQADFTEKGNRKVVLSTAQKISKNINTAISIFKTLSTIPTNRRMMWNWTMEF
ncbi:hypothetical protein [Neobacillus niacini]|uniref:hypothetical protein n=1 Tax=Neobacillus niacini TaxID=86668 RepID=UPI0028646A11|nr:hypothetical protein [Neobacillus niacini]MDR7001199.1 hypothetical protein [Neobacillus niacini]